MTSFALSESGYPRIRFIEPQGYQTFAALTANARIVATDSGGLQKEAYFHKVPGLILREQTEWVELVETGWSQLVTCSSEALLSAADRIETTRTWNEDLFGSGNSGSEIAQAILAATP